MLQVALTTSDSNRLGFGPDAQADTQVLSTAFRFAALNLWLEPDCARAEPTRRVPLGSEHDFVANGAFNATVPFPTGNLCRAELVLRAEDAAALELSLAGLGAPAGLRSASNQVVLDILGNNTAQPISAESAFAVTLDAVAWLPMAGEFEPGSTVLLTESAIQAALTTINVAVSSDPLARLQTCGARGNPCRGATEIPGIEGIMLNAIPDAASVSVCATKDGVSTPLAVKLRPLTPSYFRLPATDFRLMVYEATAPATPCAPEQRVLFDIDYSNPEHAAPTSDVLPWLFAGEGHARTEDEPGIILSEHHRAEVPSAGQAAVRVVHALTGVAPARRRRTLTAEPAEPPGRVSLGTALDDSQGFFSVDHPFSTSVEAIKPVFVGPGLKVSVTAEIEGLHLGASVVYADAGPTPRGLAFLAGDLSPEADDPAALPATLVYVALDASNRGLVRRARLRDDFPRLPE